VEAWIERREIEGLPGLVRVRIKELESGMQVYVKTDQELGQFILEAMTQGGSQELEWERDR
jgi:hypothetical protein